MENAGVVGGNEVFKDVETGSRWQQSTGEAISGPLEGSHLTLYPFILTTWKAWRTRYPNTTIVQPLRQQPYGNWEFEVKDPNGYVLVFSEPG